MDPDHLLPRADIWTMVGRTLRVSRLGEMPRTTCSIVQSLKNVGVSPNAKRAEPEETTPRKHRVLRVSLALRGGLALKAD